MQTVYKSYVKLYCIAYICFCFKKTIYNINFLDYLTHNKNFNTTYISNYNSEYYF